MTTSKDSRDSRALIAPPKKQSSAPSSPSRRKRLDHLHWLRAQAFKEYSAIKPIFSALAKLYPEVDRQIDRHQFEELTEKLADETKHARLVMDLLEELTGKKVTFADLLWLPEDREAGKNTGTIFQEFRHAAARQRRHQNERNPPTRRRT